MKGLELSTFEEKSSEQVLGVEEKMEVWRRKTRTRRT
jgi:hypothetical protein